MQKIKWNGGQGLVEFALVLPILLILVIGVLDFGIAFFVKVQLKNAAREGANYVVFNPDDGTATSPAFDKAKNEVVQEGANAGITISKSDLTINCVQTNGTVGTACPSGSTVVVLAAYKLPLAVNIFFKGPLNLVGDARMLIP